MSGEAGDGVDGLAALAPLAALASACVCLRRRWTRMARQAWGKAIPLSWSAMPQVLIERDSWRPRPVEVVVCWKAMSRQGRAAS